MDRIAVCGTADLSSILSGRTTKIWEDSPNGYGTPFETGRPQGHGGSTPSSSAIRPSFPL